MVAASQARSCARLAGRRRRARALRAPRRCGCIARTARPGVAPAAASSSYLRAQLRVAARLTARLAATRDVEEMATLVVEELHETFAFYLAAIQRLTTTGCCAWWPARGRWRR